MHPCPAGLSQGCVSDQRRPLRFELWAHQSPVNNILSEFTMFLLCCVCRIRKHSFNLWTMWPYLEFHPKNILNWDFSVSGITFFAHSVHFASRWGNQTKKSNQTNKTCLKIVQVWELLPVLPWLWFVRVVMICVIQLLTGISLCSWLICFL